MEKRAETNRNVAIIVAPDGRGLQKIFGIPAARRLILLGQQVGFDEIHVMGDVGALLPVLSDLIPPERFYPIHDPASLRRAVENFLSDWQKAIILKANLRLTGPSWPDLQVQATHRISNPQGQKERKTQMAFSWFMRPTLRPSFRIYGLLHTQPSCRTRQERRELISAFHTFSMGNKIRRNWQKTC